MVVKLSTTASAQIVNHTVDTYVECKLYNANDTYLMDLSVMTSSWNQSKDFGVSTLNLTINNSGGIHNIGATNEIKTDYIIVLIEGFDTGTGDHFPKFKGYVKNIDMDIADKYGIGIISLMGDELIEILKPRKSQKCDYIFKNISLAQLKKLKKGYSSKSSFLSIS